MIAKMKAFGRLPKRRQKKNSTLTIGELIEVSGIRQTTLKYYTELGILP